MPPLKPTECSHFKCLSEKKTKFSGRKKNCRKKREKFKLHPSFLFLTIVLKPYRWDTPISKVLPSLSHRLTHYTIFLLFFQVHVGPGSLYVNCLRQNLEDARARKPKGHACSQWISLFISRSRHGFCLSLSGLTSISLRSEGVWFPLVCIHIH